MFLENIETGEELEAEIAMLKPEDLNRIKKEKQFLFDWKSEYDKHELLFKISLKEGDEILGIMCLIDIPEELRIHIELVEVKIDQTGKNKKIDRIAGGLIAFACEESFKRRYGGFVSLLPKTKLIKHYIGKYGFSQYGRLLAIEGHTSKLLLHKYLGYEL
ncbi:MAG: hypothetical protein R2828_34905 [Saprospiraceae bacterium]